MNVLRFIIMAMLRILSKVVNEVQILCPSNLWFRCVSFTQKLNLQQIREELEKFDGGSVDLEMDEQSGIAVMILNNPKRWNSLTGKMMVDMSDRITQLEQWTNGKGLIVMGTGGKFCSGGDLTFVRQAMHCGEKMAEFQNHTLTRLLNLPLISVALVQGSAIGGGAELSTACDFRVTSATAKIGFVQIKMGLTTGWGATTRLVHLLGRQSAIKLLCSGKLYTPEEVQSQGLVDHVLPPNLSAEDELTECRQWLASQYLQYDAALTQALKASIVYSDLNRDIVKSLQNEQKVFSQFWGGPVQKAALEANMKHK